MAEIATGDADEALDIVQDVMYRMVLRYAAKPRNQWKPLFYRILQNRIRDWYRRQAVRKKWMAWLGRPFSHEDEKHENPLDTLPDTSKKNPVEQVLINDAQKDLDYALKSLPRRQQQAFLLRAWEGLNVAETALAMRCSQGSVKTHYSRAVHTLRHLLEDHRP
jgi:RNA polymerase sigma-70 factor (ECF subfamily)